MEKAEWIKKKSAASLYPAQVETALIQLTAGWPASGIPLLDVIQNFPLGENSLLHLFALSNICAARIVQNPELLLWLSQPEICSQGRDQVDMSNELHRMVGDDIAANNFRALRRWKNNEMTRIALRELANAAAFEETTAELSQLAEICVRELAYEFLRQHQPFIYPRSPTPDLLDEIAKIKRRIERDVARSDALERDVKLGRGGIREIEFVVQTLQFIHGGRHVFLQETGTLNALRALARLELIPDKEVVDLDRAYRFLRTVEHRLQIEAEQQTHTLPRDRAVLDRLARSLAFDSITDFNAILKKNMENVRSVFDRVISSAPTETASPDLKSFKDEKSATRSLGDLLKPTSASHVAPRTKQVFAKLRPSLRDQIAETARPDAI